MIVKEPMTATAPRVLLGEDNPQDVYLIQMAFTESGLAPNLTVLSDGAEMLEELESVSKSDRMPDLIVLDLNLPRHDGLEILAFVRQRDNLSSIPLVILTSSDSPKDVTAASRLGFHNYIRKPSSLDEFLAIGGIFRKLIEKQPLMAESVSVSS